ncbi:hypothetical protein HIM_10141 [Hirsutella minnesotensis 3608]|uniref:Dynamin N-terminal domain-containing protein n=1 Tax=Hirsutella minnesotensis 3608 TaxID=1043627 RepID=A0A0F8A2K6_9HYPO|nr:hypothetical protein HIM_10141 [Hirsutella minnesotensis 3608]
MASHALQSKDHRDLLDIIDNMRSQGIRRYVDLPEIIVCGDQSAGKSSVLEAISGMEFPTKDNLFFHVEIDHSEPDIGSIIEKAKEAMGISDTKAFSTDTLRVELTMRADSAASHHGRPPWPLSGGKPRPVS